MIPKTVAESEKVLSQGIRGLVYVMIYAYDIAIENDAFNLNCPKARYYVVERLRMRIEFLDANNLDYTYIDGY